MLQKNPVLEAIGKAVTSRILADLDKLADDDKETLREGLGGLRRRCIKEGLYEDAERRDALYKIARFRTTTGGETWRSLADYVAALRPNQTAIYYALGDDEAAILASPQLEGFARRGIEVLVLSDPVDAFWVRTALGYDGKPFQSVTQGAADLDKIPLAEGATPAEAAPESAVATLAALFKQTLGDKVSAVRASARLTDERGLPGRARSRPRPAAREDPRPRTSSSRRRRAPVLELNPTHPLIKALAGQGGRRRRRRGARGRGGASSSARRASSTARRRTIPPIAARVGAADRERLGADTPQ